MYISTLSVVSWIVLSAAILVPCIDSAAVESLPEAMADEDDVEGIEGPPIID